MATRGDNCEKNMAAEDKRDSPGRMEQDGAFRKAAIDTDYFLQIIKNAQIRTILRRCG